MKIIPILLIALMVLGSYSTFNYAYAVDNNCMIIPIHIIQMPIPLGCIEQRLDTLENATPSGADTTICGNQGGKTLIHISGTNCDAKSLIGSADISITNSSNTITIDYNGTLATESTNCNNLGTGVPIHKVGSNCNAFSLIAGGSISITNTTDDYTIANTSPETTTCTSAGGTTLIKSSSGGNCDFKGLTAQNSGITITSNTNDNGIGNAGVISNSCSAPIVCSGTNPSAISFTKTYKIEAEVFQAVTKTNLPTVYTDVYVTAFDNEDMMAFIDCTGVTNFVISYMWDFIGAGTDQIRWVDVGNNANILKEDAAISADQDPRTIVFSRPAFCTDGVQISIEMQAKSSNGTNDPIAKGYTIWAN